MATHSSVLAQRIPGTGEPGGLPSIGSDRVGHNCSDLAQHCTECRHFPFIELIIDHKPCSTEEETRV